MKAVMSIISAFVVGAVFAEQPDKWVRYVESTGSQAINTGITGRYGTKAEMRVEWMTLDDNSFAGARTSGSGNDRLYLCHSGGNGAILTGCGEWKNCQKNGKNCFYELNRRYTVVSEFSEKTSDNTMQNTVTVDGVKVYDASAPAFDTGRSIAIFGCMVGGSPGYFSKARCYGFKIWQDGNLVRDYIPCVKNHRAGLYDSVTGEIFYSVTGTDLVCDEDSFTPDEFIDYAEANGDAYIDTGIIGRSGTGAEFKMAWLEQMVQIQKEASLLGARADGDTRFFIWFFANLSCAYGYGTFRYPNVNDPASYMRYGTDSWDGKALDWYSSRIYEASADFAVGRHQIRYLSASGEKKTMLDSTSDASEVNTGLPMYLFAANVKGKAEYKAHARLYSMKITQDGALVRDFRPCLKHGEVGLYDDVSKRIFYPTVGTLSAPPRTKKMRKRDVAFVEYIESDGYTTLDTGVRAKSGTRASGEFSWVQLRAKTDEADVYLEEAVKRNERAYLGASDSAASAETWFYMVHTGNRALWAGYGRSGAYATNGTANISMTTGTKYSFDVLFAKGAQTLSLDGTTVVGAAWDAEVDARYNLRLFGGVDKFQSAARCYGLKLWQDGELVRDFKPCVVDGKAMLYDEVSESVFKPVPDIAAAGHVGTYILSGEEKPAAYVEYVESDGTQFVDTGVVGKSGVSADFKMAFLATEDKGFLESRKGNDRYYLWHNGAGQMMYGYGGFFGFGSYEVGRAYEVHSSLKAGSQVISIDGIAAINATDAATVDTGYNLYIFTCNLNGTPQYHGKSRLYWLKLYDESGNLVRNYKPVRLTNGLVTLWDFANKVVYPAKSVNAPYGITTFSKVGPEGDAIVPGLMIFIR